MSKAADCLHVVRSNHVESFKVGAPPSVLGPSHRDSWLILDKTA